MDGLYHAALLLPALTVIILAVCLYQYKRLKQRCKAKRQERQRRNPGLVMVGLFHPYCNAGGGGERVLWCAVRAIQRQYTHASIVVYTGDTDSNGVDILRKAKKAFGVSPLRPVEFVFLEKRHWVEAKRYPVFTLLGQSIGSIILGWEAMQKCVPDIYIDTMGYAFTYPLFRLLCDCKVGAYVHYPTISTDMLTKVQNREAAHNNRGTVSRSAVLSKGKETYYKAFVYLYRLVGGLANVVMVNSTWTFDNIDTIWNTREGVTSIVYPPCDTVGFEALPLTERRVPNKIISVAQFRPEKDHELQIRALDQYLRENPLAKENDTKLYMIGGCRNEDDENRVRNLKLLADSLSISQYISFKTNVTYSELKDHLATAQVGMHTMWNEHFGIGVVEYLAAGVIALAHDTAGPKFDIVLEEFQGKGPCGYRASTQGQYAQQLKHILLDMGDAERQVVQTVARASVSHRFSEDMFDKKFLERLREIL